MKPVDPPENPVILGKITSAYGIKGWVKIHSFTDPIDAILQYQPWCLRQRGHWQQLQVEQGKIHGKSIVVKFQEVPDRNGAELLRGWEIVVDRNQLPELEDDEYYWIDLEGMEVVNEQDQFLGTVRQVMPTGANEVLVVKDAERERLIPLVMEHYVKEIDPQSNRILVDWDPEF